MGAKALDDIELWFEQTPVKQARNNKLGEKPVIAPVRALDGVSSRDLLGELVRRHYKLVLWDGVLVGVGALIVLLIRG